MKKIFNLSILFFFINLSFASSEIFYIDIERLINFSEPGKYINEKITDSNKISDEKFNKIRDNLKQKEELLISQKNILNKKEFNSKLSDLQMEVEKFNIESWWNKRIEDLSKGMAQKIQFITTILHQPELLILDEPFSGLDPANSELIKNEILQLKKEKTTLIV